MRILEQFLLKGKTAIVTGAAKTSGLCCTMATALQEAGARVVLMDISSDVHKLAEKLGGENNNFYAVEANLTEKTSREAGFAEAVRLLGDRLDILLNGAGIQFRCDAIEFPADKWNSIIDTNLTALFFMCQLAGAVMIKQGNGKIINIASMTAFMPSRRIPAYAASKGGVMQITKALSNEWAVFGINVNAIAPGYMQTELTLDLQNTEIGKTQAMRIPAGRWGKPDDLSGATVFLASPASDYINGIVIPVDGGYLGA